MDWAFDITLKNRAILKSYLETLPLSELNTIPQGFNNNIIWNIAHTIATQQLLVYGLSGESTMMPGSMIDRFRKGTKPEGDLSQEDINHIKDLLFSTIEKTKEDYNNGVFQNFKTYTVKTKSTLTNVTEAITFNNFHEGIHLGYILALKKSL